MPKQLAAMAGAVDVANPTLMVVGSFVLKNGVDGNRFESDSLLDWNEVETHKGADGRVDGMITEMGQTKVRMSGARRTTPKLAARSRERRGWLCWV